ncbi:uncharacterized protein LOC110391560 isoform X2 [Numida meleagris]|uniref:uncharacterized protein LOC110391560 isoform X2 n=1 Tax=Numida meleagris TaxID=8996 RepID=UPI000B3E082E|nr:uncharacterized protein LOC110391560 isoform X2 [Numida meleagris]
MVLWCLLALQTPLQRAAGLKKRIMKRNQAAGSFPSPSNLLPGWEWIHAVSEPLLPASRYWLRRGCSQPGAGCNWSLLRDWGGGSGGAPGAPREEAAAVPASRRRSLPPRVPLRTGTGSGSAESGPVHPGGSSPIPPPEAEEGELLRKGDIFSNGSPSSQHLKAAMPHFLDWFVPVYLMISILILVGFGACIYYFEPGLQEAHKWRTQRPIMERDLRKTLMIRDNLAFGVPEV